MNSYFAMMIGMALFSFSLTSPFWKVSDKTEDFVIGLDSVCWCNPIDEQCRVLDSQTAKPIKFLKSFDCFLFDSTQTAIIVVCVLDVFLVSYFYQYICNRVHNLREGHLSNDQKVPPTVVMTLSIIITFIEFLIFVCLRELLVTNESVNMGAEYRAAAGILHFISCCFLFIRYAPSASRSSEVELFTWVDRMLFGMSLASLCLSTAALGHPSWSSIDETYTVGLFDACRCIKSGNFGPIDSSEDGGFSEIYDFLKFVVAFSYTVSLIYIVSPLFYPVSLTKSRVYMFLMLTTLCIAQVALITIGDFHLASGDVVSIRNGIANMFFNVSVICLVWGVYSSINHNNSVPEIKKAIQPPPPQIIITADS